MASAAREQSKLCFMPRRGRFSKGLRFVKWTFIADMSGTRVIEGWMDGSDILLLLCHTQGLRLGSKPPVLAFFLGGGGGIRPPPPPFLLPFDGM